MNRTHAMGDYPTEEVSRYLTVGEPPVNKLTLASRSFSPPFSTADMYAMAELIALATKSGDAWTVTAHPSGDVWLTFPSVMTKSRRA
jgi:hypothetical protein